MAVQRQFYRDIHKWIKGGCNPVNEFLFIDSVGLCANYVNWLYATYRYEKDIIADFEKAGLNRTYPFNKGSGELYNKEGEFKYNNPERLKWIKDHTR